MNKLIIESYEEFLNEQNKYQKVLNEDLEYNKDPKSYVAFKTIVGPLWAGFSVFSNNGNNKETKIFPHLGDRTQKLLIDGPQFRKDIVKSLNISNKEYAEGIKLKIPKDEFLKLLKKEKFKKKAKNDYEIQVPTDHPERGVIVIVDFLKKYEKDFIK